MNRFPAFLQESRQRVNRTLLSHLALQSSPYAAADNKQLARLREANIYCVGNGGKRLRPALLYATAHCLNDKLDTADLDLLAAAIECIHSYSLVHDDLPAMDDDELRRGKPTCHIAFDEATAILAGDGLQAFAFELITLTRTLSAETQVQLVRELAQAAGNHGMVGGQAIDLASTSHTVDPSHLEQMHSLKTGALIRASVAMGAIAAGADMLTRQRLDRYASTIGLAFQVQDDILDIESDTATLGKTQGADQKHHKATYPALLGLPQAKAKAAELIRQSHDALAKIDSDCSLLHQLADFIVQRSH